MNFYTKIPIWENKRRIKKLTEFRELVQTYFNNSRKDWRTENRIEEEEAQKARVEINLRLDEVHKLILMSGRNPSVTSLPPAATGGYITNIDLIYNIFVLDRHYRGPQSFIFDLIDRSIGIYQSNQFQAWVRTFNPIFYLEILLDGMASLPFILLGKIGFDQNRAEASFIGKVLKGSMYGILWLVSVPAGLLTILYYLDYLEPFKKFLKATVGSD